MRENQGKVSRKWIALWLVMSLFITGIGINSTVMTSYAYTATSGVIKNGPAKVRTAPVDGEKITTFQNGTTVVVVDETTGSDGMVWYKVQFSYAQKNFEGYIRSDLVELSSGEASAGSTITDNTQAGKTGTVTNTSGGVYVRSGAGTAYSIQTKVYKGQSLNILGQAAASNGVLWYNVSFSLNGTDYTGWICGDYVILNDEAATAPETPGTEVTATDEEYIATLKNAGFPESYCGALLALHKKYPNWQFQAVQTGLDWATVIEKQNVPGKNLVQSSVNDARKSTDSAAYNWKTDQWYG